MIKYVTKNEMRNEHIPELGSGILLHFKSLCNRLNTDEKTFRDALENPHRHDVEHTKTRGLALSEEHADSIVEYAQALMLKGSSYIGRHYGVLPYRDLKSGRVVVVDTQPRVYESETNMMHGIGRLYNGEVPTVSVFDSNDLRRHDKEAFGHLPKDKTVVLVWRGHHRMYAWRDYLARKKVNLPVVIVGNPSQTANLHASNMEIVRTAMRTGVEKHLEWVSRASDEE